MPSQGAVGQPGGSGQEAPPCLTTAKSEPGEGEGVSHKGHRGAKAQKPEDRPVQGPGDLRGRVWVPSWATG